MTTVVVTVPASTVPVPASTIQYAIQISDALATLEAAGYTVTPPGSTKPPPSAVGTTITTVGPAITDGSSNTWALNASKQIVVNGTADATSANVETLYWDGTLVWQESSAFTPPLWWSKTAPTAAWLPASGTPTSPIPGSVTPPPVSGSLTATPLVLVTQGGANNTDMNTQSLSWPAVTGATGYEVYRNGAAYATTTALDYVDSNATNSSNGGTWAEPTTIYAYQVAPVNASGTGPKAAQVASYLYYKGAHYSDQDFSYGNVETNYAASFEGSTVISVYFNNGGWQPVFRPTQTTNDDFEIGGFDYVVMDINPGATVPTLASRFGMLTRTPLGDTATWNGVDLMKYGTLKANTWVTFKVPKADLGLGLGTVTGSIANGTLTVTKQLTGIPVDGGAFITGPGIPAGIFVSALGQQNGIGTFTLGGPGAGSLNIASTTLNVQRTGCYKFNLNFPNEAPTLYFNNVGFETY